MAQALTWHGEDVRLAEVERRLSDLRSSDDGVPIMRTSVLTHVAWVPPEWREAAEGVLGGLGERHPSRTLVLFPEPESHRDAIDAEVAVETFTLPALERSIATEIVRLWLHNGRTRAPASVVLPLALPDLPVFLRWRGRPEFFAGQFEQLIDVADRLIVDSSEWPDLPAAYGEFSEFFDRVAASDIAWARTEQWRLALARLWPGIAQMQKLRVEGPLADALLLAGWLRSRLGREVALDHEPGDAVTAVGVDGEPVDPGTREPKTPSDLLSDQLEVYGRDRVYEEAVRSAVT